MKRKITAAILTMCLAASLTACGGTSTSGGSTTESAAAPAAATEAAPAATEAAPAATEAAPAATEAAPAAADTSSIKVGVIYIGDENEGYTASHMKGVKEMKDALGLSDDQVIEKTNIAEDESCYDAAIDLAEQGCTAIFATSFGHEDYLIQAAGEYPDIQFFHATGYQAATSGLPNMHNYFDKIYEARYVTGIVAGMKLNQMIEDGTITEDAAKIGYVGAYPYAEVVSGYTSFFLGVRSICPSATMEVKYTNSWADMSAEAEVASQLIADKCVLISQHADTTGAPSTCEAEGVPCVGYNVDMVSVAPNAAMTSSSNNWGVYYNMAVSSVVNGESVPVDWADGYDSGAVYITPINEKVAAEGTQAKVDEAEAALKAGKLHVFDTSTFTVGGKSLEDLIAEGGDNEKYSQYVSDGYFHESEVASAPAFDLRIDGITEQQ
ncbi:MAG: BMP family ABC transporter substrate-binding protein [Lachnospiraceae bacterium]|nr:BMP family ABC transporter substrate-binding protein [Lachnospiraceae bacterium]